MSENISSSVLFHFTDSMDNLKSILKNGFFPRYCPEYLFGPIHTNAALKNLPPPIAIPMVSFCDLPLALIKFHLGEYGKFGIGLTKQWGIRNGVSPVLYIHEQSQLFNPLSKRLWAARNEGDLAATNDLRLLMAYTKPVSGPAWRKGKTQKVVKFYDEREWRYVPSLPEGKPLQIALEDYTDVSNRELLHQSLKEKYKLTIGADDIQYIVLPESKGEEEILNFVRFLNKIFTLRDAILVTTTIMTTDCILHDI